MDLTDLNNYLPKKEIAFNCVLPERSNTLSVSLLMERRKNRSVWTLDNYLKGYLEFLAEAHLQWGFEYYMYPELTRRMLPAILILRRANITTGVDIDDNGQITRELLMFNIEDDVA